jgi:CDP-6-deoxy-D-xylo-4-hexulose-3-dehydrase
MEIEKKIRTFVNKNFSHRSSIFKNSKYRYPLLNVAFTKKDIFEGIKNLMSTQITMSKKTLEFEKYFTKYFKSKHAIMTNSGSSANLLAAALICNPRYKKQLKRGDEILVPSVCWPTSIWPFVLFGLKPKFKDIDIDNLCISLDLIKKNITKKTKAIVIINVLGQSPNMIELAKYIKKKKLILIEDNCESLGSTYKKKFLGTYGDFGTFSFYFSHQITSGEGGMIVCKDKRDEEILKTLRSHGWARNINLNKKFRKKYKDIDNRFMFINSGFNLRPLDLQAAIAKSQLLNFKKIQKIRNLNRKKIINNTIKNKNYRQQIHFIINKDKYLKPAWFGIPILINPKFLNKKKIYLKYLDKLGIETRPIISGNFLRQPAAKLYNFDKYARKFKNANHIHDCGFFIGLHSTPINNLDLNFIIKNLLKIDEM